MSPEEQLAGFIARFTPEIAAMAHAVLERLRARLLGPVELVYDNYNGLVIGFGPSERLRGPALGRRLPALDRAVLPPGGPPARSGCGTLRA